ncbi:MAG: hypothetical protein QM820_52970 [Minicystis sp.]
MTRTTLALTAILVASFTSGCGRYYYRHRVMYAVPAEPVAVVAVRPVYAPPPPPVAPPPPPAARPIVVHAPPGSVVIVNPGRPPVVRQQMPAEPEMPVAPEAPAEPEAPAPAVPAEPEEGWFNGR